MPPAVDVASATSVCKPDLAWESGLAPMFSRRRLVGINANTSKLHNSIRLILVFVCLGILSAWGIDTLYVPLQAGESIYLRVLSACLFSHRGF